MNLEQADEVLDGVRSRWDHADAPHNPDMLALIRVAELLRSRADYPPTDYACQLRDAVLEAEQNADSKEGGSIWKSRAENYAMGLRTAAGLYGLREGMDPVTRRRYPRCLGPRVPCAACRAEAEQAARDRIAQVGDLIPEHVADIPTNVLEVVDRQGDVWRRLAGDDRYIPDDDDPSRPAYDWGTPSRQDQGYYGHSTTSGLLHYAPLTVAKTAAPPAGGSGG